MSPASTEVAVARPAGERQPDSVPDASTVLADACARAAEWPLPGGGATARRFELLTDQARGDLVLGRMVEAHADALAILAELAGADPAGAGAGRRWGVWTSGPPAALEAVRTAEGPAADGPVNNEWSIRGVKHWCSGATLCTHALVDAATDEGQQLLAVDLSHPGVLVHDSEWVGRGMSGTDTRTVTFRDVPAAGVGPPGAYLDRPGFWMGAIGVAACWRGGTVAVADALRQAAAARPDTHLLVHLAAVHVAGEQSRALLVEAARSLDAAPRAHHAVLARTVRAAVERNAVSVIDRVGRALGPGPLVNDARHAGLVADLQVYIRQHHAERDLEQLGADLVARGPSWTG